MFRPLFFAGLLCHALAAPLCAGDSGGKALRAALPGLGAAPCALGALRCVTLKVPRDHLANDPDATIDVTFAISLASKASKGILLYVVGGPGGSGLAVADDYLAAFDASLTENMDIVFFDQRGTGPATGLECPAAGAAFDTAAMPLEPPDAAIAVARRFVADCQAELAETELLPFVNTAQAIRDLEVFRGQTGGAKIWIYGESYGTQFAQEYARAFPQAIRGVILDGVVDLNLSNEAFYKTYITASERILNRVFAACATQSGCEADMGADAGQVYDGLVAQLAKAPATVSLPLADGTLATRVLTADMLQTNAFYGLYGVQGRADFLRALAAAAQGDLRPMLRQAYVNLLINPATGESIPDPTWYGAAYYAITCSDARDPGEGTEAVMDQIIAEARAFALQAPRLLRAYYAERLACALWPRHGPLQRPAPFAGGDYPTLVLNADTDPITSVSMAYSVFQNVRNGYLVVMQGGPHVIWGRGFACPDQIVQALLYDGTLPEAGVQICKQDFTAGYEPLTMRNPADAKDAFTVLRSLATEVNQSPGLNSWDGEAALAIGCDHGGSVTVSAGEDATVYAFQACGWWPGLTFDGTGTKVEAGDAGDGLTLDLAISGAHAGRIIYRHNSHTEAVSLSGSYDGGPASTPLPVP